jgi:hypothetical protein
MLAPLCGGGKNMRWIFSLAILFLTGLSAHAEDKDYSSSTLVKTGEGAVLELREPVRVHPVSDVYRLIELRCTEGSKSIRVLLPVDKAASLAMEDSTLKRAKGRWSMVFKAHGKDYSEKVEFRPIAEKRSRVALAAEITVEYDDPLWKALVDKSGNKFWIMNGGLGTNVSVTDEAELSKFLAACHLGNK